MAGGEFDFIRWICHTRPNVTGVLVGPGDDCAVITPGSRHQLITTDVLTEDVDFHVDTCGAKVVGRKAMAVNLSDIAAMAGRPRFAVVGLVLPKRPDAMTIARELFEGLSEVADRYGVALVGGDTNSWSGGLVLSVTMLGDVTDRGAVCRGGAKPGDWLFVTGPCGGSILGRHLNPTPRIAEAMQLHARVDLHAMIDISDGLSSDLIHILDASRCGAVLQAEAIPIHEDAFELAKRTGKSPLEHALGDGEDFELIFAVSASEGKQLEAEGHLKIGECVESGLWLETNGQRVPLRPSGWEHSME